MSQAIVPFRHPVVGAVDAVSAAVDAVPGSGPVWLSTAEKDHVLTVLTREVARLQALQLRVSAASGDVAEAHGTRDAGAWLAHASRQDAGEGRAAKRLADGLGRWPLLAVAYAAGDASTGQVRVIGRALDELPADPDPEVRVRAERYLVEQARHYTPKQLRVLGRKVLDVIAPEVAGSTKRGWWQPRSSTPGTTPPSATDGSATGCRGRWWRSPTR